MCFGKIRKHELVDSNLVANKESYQYNCPRYGGIFEVLHLTQIYGFLRIERFNHQRSQSTGKALFPVVLSCHF